MISGRVRSRTSPEARATPKPKSGDQGGRPPKRRRQEGALPGFVAPALATLSAEAAARRRWVHEIKFDGYRLQARSHGKVRLLTRSGQDWTRRSARGRRRRSAPCRSSRDPRWRAGGRGRERASDFSALQADLRAGRATASSTMSSTCSISTARPARDAADASARSGWRQLLAGGPGPCASASISRDGEMMLRACLPAEPGGHHLEAARRPLSGPAAQGVDQIEMLHARNSWSRAMCRPPPRARPVGSLVLGLLRDGELVHAGRVGTGLHREVAADLAAARAHRAQVPRRSPNAEADAARGVRWVEPQLVAEVEFRAWTGTAAAPRCFRGLREDKRRVRWCAKRRRSRAEARAARRRCKLTHPDRVYWPDAGVTKQALADYYAEVWPRMAPYRRQPAAGAAALPGRHRGPVLLPEACLEGPEPRASWPSHDPEDDERELLVAVDDLPG